MIELTKEETEKLRELFWKAKESEEALKGALNETALAHGADLEKARWNVSADFKRLVKV